MFGINWVATSNVAGLTARSEFVSHSLYIVCSSNPLYSTTLLHCIKCIMGCIKCIMGCIKCIMGYIKCIMGCIKCIMGYIKCIMGCIRCYLSPLAYSRDISCSRHTGSLCCLLGLQSGQQCRDLNLPQNFIGSTMRCAFFKSLGRGN